jgi:hypothetical protein
VFCKAGLKGRRKKKTKVRRRNIHSIILIERKIVLFALLI